MTQTLKEQQQGDQLSMDSAAKSYLVNNLGINLNNYTSFKNSYNNHFTSNNGYDVTHRDD